MMRIDSAQLLHPDGVKETDISVTRLVCDITDHGTSAPFELEDSFLLTTAFAPFQFDFQCRGKPLPRAAYPIGITGIFEMDRRWSTDLRSSFDLMHFHFTRASLDRLSIDLGIKPIARLHCPIGQGTIDESLLHLGLSLIPALKKPREMNKLFTDYVTLAIGAHVARMYGDARLESSIGGGLSPRQFRRVTDLIDANLEGKIGASEIANECGMSVGHLHRAFRRTTNTTLHRWLIQRRIERAKALLTSGEIPLAELALSCGFSDQSHLTRIFSQWVGKSPRAWQRANDF